MMNREESDLNKNAETTCLIHRNVGSSDSDLGSSGSNTPFFMSRVKAEIDDIEPEFRLECLTCGKVFTNRDDIDFHATSCQMNEDGVMSTSEVARYDSRFILNTIKECDKSTSGTAENTVEMSVVHNLSMECSKATTDHVTSPSQVPYQTSYEIENIDGKVPGIVVGDKEVAKRIPLPPEENSSSSTEKIKFLEIKLSKKLSWIPCQFCETFVPNQAKLNYHFACRHYSPKIFDDTFDDRDQADKEKEAEGSEVQFVMAEEIFIQPEVRMTRWSQTQCETCHAFFFSEDDLLRHSCRSKRKRRGDSKSFDSRIILNTNTECDKSISGRAETPVEMSRTSLSFPNKKSILSGLELNGEQNGVAYNLSMECSKATTDHVTSPSHVPYQTSFEIENIDGKVLGVVVDDKEVTEGIPLPPKENDLSSTEEIKLSKKSSWIPCQFCGTFVPTQAKLGYHVACHHYSPKIFDDTFDDRDQADEEMEAEGSDVQFVMAEEIFIQPEVRMTRWSQTQCETCHAFVFSEDDLLRHSCRSIAKGQVKSQRKQALLSKQNEGNSYDCKDDSDVVKRRSSSHCKQIRKSRKVRKLCSDSSTSIKVKSRESRTRKSNKVVSKLSSKSGKEMYSPGSRKTRPKLQCMECFKWYQNKNSLRIHMRSHRGEKPFECATCFRKFGRQDLLKRHQVIHDSNDKPFECDICHRKFSQKTNMKTHRKLHTRVLPLKCRFCPLKFGDQFYLIPHERLHMGPRPFKCGQCSATFSTNTNLKRHQFSHTGERPFNCDQCSATFSTKATLRKHKATHSDHLPFKCNSCPKRCRTKPDLHSHELTHLTERPFKCDLCPRSYVRKGQLADHKRVHTGERPHKCDVCSKGFRSKKDLTGHKKLHSPTEFKCDVCEKTFKLEKYLRRHKTTQSCGKPYKYKCDICNNIFQTASDLSYHREKRCVGHEKVNEEPISSKTSTNSSQDV